MKFKKVLLSFAIFITVSTGLALAEKTSVKGLNRYKLDNGLEVFIQEDHTVPLAYIEIAVRAGGVTQTPETAGLFHLYEHMMFAGNRLYKDSAASSKAMADMGVTSHNGVTSSDMVRYFFTIPSYSLEQGLAYWNAAIRTPLIEENEFENEKKVVLSEIEGDKANPAYVNYKYMQLSLFPDQPWKTDVGGSYDIVRNATLAQMREMQRTYYIPCNAALFIGGDVNPDRAIELVKTIYGTWSNNGMSRPGKEQQLEPRPLAQTKYAVMPYEKLPEQAAHIYMAWRGPDCEFAKNEINTAEYLSYILNKPDSEMNTILPENPELKIPDQTYTDFSLGLRRITSTMSFIAVVTEPQENLAKRAMLLKDEFYGKVIPQTLSNKANFSSAEKAKFKSQIEDAEASIMETPESILSALRDTWAKYDADTFFEKFNLKISQKECDAFARKYITEVSPYVVVLVNPKLYEEQKQEFESLGFYTIRMDEKNWWDLPQYQPKADLIPKETDFVLEEEIYVPSQNQNAVQSETKRNVETLTLANGIPLYVVNTPSVKNSIAIACTGGITHLTKETSGLEDALFSVMCQSSDKYSYDKRNSIYFDTSAYIGNDCITSGTIMSLVSRDKYFDTLLDVFTDGFLHPNFEEKVLLMLNTSLSQSVQHMQNDPVSILSRTVINDIYKGHPHAARTRVTPESAQNITEENMRELHRKIVDGGNWFVVAAGNINAKALAKKLNQTLGAVKFSGEKHFEEIQVNPIEVAAKKPVIVTHPSAEGAAHVVRVFTSPSLDSSDYIPTAMAASIYRDTYYAIVREKYGICYTPSVSLSASRAPFGQEFLYKVTDYKNIVKASEEAKQIMLGGKVIGSKNPDGTYQLDSIEERLQSYKNRYINSLYEDEKTAKDKLFNLTVNMIHYGDMNQDLKNLEAIKALTAQDIIQAFRKYWTGNPGTWYAVTFPGNEKNFSFD